MSYNSIHSRSNKYHSDGTMKSESQQRREEYPYRAMYFKYNPGICNNIWICSQCHKILIGKQNVVIDHIVPLAKGGKNDVSNCTACCQACNSSKSDKIDYRVGRGKRFKVIESALFSAQRAGGAGITGILALFASLFMWLFEGGVKVGGRAGKKVGKGLLRIATRTIAFVVKTTVGLITYPIRKGKLISRAFFLVVYLVAVLILLRDNTNILAAWM